MAFNLSLFSGVKSAVFPEPGRRAVPSILLIDDDPDQLLLLESLLIRHGFKVTLADEAHDALDLVSRRRFDLVICDMKMPEMSGFEFVKAVRGSDLASTAEVPIILLTALCVDIEFSVLQAGANMYCEKRNARKTLVRQVRMLLNLD